MALPANAAGKTVIMPYPKKIDEIETSFANFEIQTTTSAEHSIENDVTQFPVESGIDITDNMYTRPRMLTLNCVVSTLNQILQFFKNKNVQNIDDVWNYLSILAENKVMMTVVTSRDIYENMVVKSISKPQSVETNGRLVFTIVFQEIKLAYSSTTEKVIPKEDKKDIASKKKKQGKKPKKGANTTQSGKINKNSSLLKKIGG